MVDPMGSATIDIIAERGCHVPTAGYPQGAPCGGDKRVSERIPNQFILCERADCGYRQRIERRETAQYL